MRCKYIRKIFQNEENGYTVALFSTLDYEVPLSARDKFWADKKIIAFTAKGYDLPLTDEIEIEMEGEWETNSHGTQYKVETFLEVVPRTREGILGYLSCGSLKGIGPKTAERIVNRFGLDTLEVMEKYPQELLKIQGISQKKLDRIVDSFGKNKVFRELMTFLSPFHVTPKKANMILQKFRDQSVEIIRKQPYILCSVKGFGFLTVDAIARQCCAATNDPMRISGWFHALKADENNDLIYGNAGAVIVLLNLYHLAQKDIYLQLACEAGNILIKNQNKGKWCCGNGQSLSGLSHGITGIIYALTKLNNEQFHIEYQKAIHSGLIYENTMYSDKYNNWLDNREEAKKEENSDNRCMAAWCHGAPGILLARSKMYNLVKDSSDYITVQCDIERALFATKMYGFTDNDCLCHGNLGNTEILLEYSKECNDEEVRHMMLSARTQIAMDIINENYDCARSYLHGYKIPGFMTGISGMGYSLLRDLYPELPCILALEI